ncbi:MAG: transmembrane sensor [Rhodothermales bacterium]|jgi:transmembrane sensor
MSDSLPTDRDLKLANLLGQEAALPESGTDPVVDALTQWRSAHQSADVDNRAGARMWAHVERKIRAGSDRPALRLITPMRLVWSTATVAAAAAVLILIVVPRLLSPASGQLVAQASNQQTLFTTQDGSTVLLRANSSLYQMEEHAWRLEGDAYFDVTSNPERVFAVETAGGLIEVLGTRFSVTARDLDTRVFLEEGSVRFSAGQGNVLLEPGQAIETNGGVIGPVVASDGSEDLDWTRGEVFFDSRPAGLVAEELGWHFGLDLQLPADSRSEAVSGRLVLSDRDRALEDFALVLGGRFVESGEALRFIRD